MKIAKTTSNGLSQTKDRTGIYKVIFRSLMILVKTFTKVPITLT